MDSKVFNLMLLQQRKTYKKWKVKTVQLRREFAFKLHLPGWWRQQISQQIQGNNDKNRCFCTEICLSKELANGEHQFTFFHAIHLHITHLDYLFIFFFFLSFLTHRTLKSFFVIRDGRELFL